MADLEHPEALLQVWERVFLTEDPLEALRREGIVLSDALRRRLATASLHPTPSAAGSPPRPCSACPQGSGCALPEVRAAGVSRVSFDAGPAALPSPSTTLPRGEYDLVVGIGLGVVDATLAGLYDTHTWPHELPRSRARRLFFAAGVLVGTGASHPDSSSPDRLIGAPFTSTRPNGAEQVHEVC